MTILSNEFKTQLSDINYMGSLVSSMISIESPKSMPNLCCRTSADWDACVREMKDSGERFAIIQFPEYHNQSNYMWELLIYQTPATNWGLYAFRAVCKSRRFS